MRQKDSAKVVLTDERGGGRISVGMESFFDFNFQLSEALEILVAEWMPLAAPVDLDSSRWDPESRCSGE